jgi:hypothetical protein
MLKQKVQSKKSKKIYLMLAVTLIVVAGIIAFFAYRSWSSKKPATTASQLTKGEVSTGSGKSSDKSDKSGNSSSTSGLGSQTSDDKNEASNQPNANATLIAPTGTFVSNHRPNLSGSPAPNEEQSTCNTTPGATCQISFTYNGVTKSLPEQTADSGGATYWTWSLQEIGLTEGSWQIQATARLNGKTLTGSDALKLDVQP